MMNYIAEIKGFYDLVQLKGLSSGQIALWHGLMYMANKTGWKDTFNAPNISLELLTGLSRSAILKSRNVLKQLGLIDFKPNGTKATTYILKSTQVSMQSSVQDSVQNSMQSSVQDSVQNSTPYINETKTKQKKDTNVSKEKTVSAASNRFIPPALQEVQAYCQERGNKVDPGQFIDFYAAKGWMVGKNKMKDWKACVRTWERSEQNKAPIKQSEKKNTFHNFQQRDTDYDALVRDYYTQAF